MGSFYTLYTYLSQYIVKVLYSPGLNKRRSTFAWSFCLLLHHPISNILCHTNPLMPSFTTSMNLVCALPLLLLLPGRSIFNILCAVSFFFFCQGHCFQTMHHSRPHYPLVNLSSYSCCYPSVTNHPWHSSLPTPP